MNTSKNADSSLPLNYTMSIINGKWKAAILWCLSSRENSIRYAELKRLIPNEISHKVLSQQLKALTDEELINRTVIVYEQNKNIRHVEYSLTPKGRSLCNIISLLHDWGSVFGNFDMKAELSSSRAAMENNKLVYTIQSFPDANSNKAYTDTITWSVSYNEAIA